MRLAFATLCFLAAGCAVSNHTAWPQEQLAPATKAAPRTCFGGMTSGQFSAASAASNNAWPREQPAPPIGGAPWATAAGVNTAASGGRLASEKAAPFAVGPFELAAKDSSAWLRFQFAGQLRMDFERLDRGRGEDASNALTTRARRIRPVCTLNLPEQHLSFRLHLSTSPGSLELMDFYFEYQARPNLSLRFGQYKVPFTRYRIQSFQHLTFVDWAIVTKAFGAERQMGVALHNGYEKPPKYGYAFGVFSGANARSSHAMLLPEIYGEVKPNPSDLAHPGELPEFQPELFVHLSYSDRALDLQSDTDATRGDLRCGAMFSAGWDLDPTPHQDFRLRLAPEFLAKYHGLSFSTVGYAGFSRVGHPDGTELSMMGGLAQAAYRVSGRYEVSARYAIVDLRDALLEDTYGEASQALEDTEATRNGRSEMATGEETIAASSASTAGGQLLREEEAWIGLNTYILDHTLKWQNDAGWLMHEYGDRDLTDFVVRSQFQLTF